VFEDAQWIDPTSKLLLGRLGEWAKKANALVAITLRTDDRDDVDGLSQGRRILAPDGSYSDHVTVREIRELKAADGRKWPPPPRPARAARSTPRNWRR
jgi:hypothetical protein